jgi:DNA-binding transcriptional regulator YiaG
MASDLAQVIGVCADSLYAWETGRRSPDPRHRERYAEALALLAGTLP